MGYLIGGVLVALGLFLVIGGAKGDATKVFTALTGQGLTPKAPKDGTETRDPLSVLPPGKQYVDGTGPNPTPPHTSHGGIGPGTPMSYPQSNGLVVTSV